MVKKTKQNPGLEHVCYENKAGTIEETMKRKADQMSNPLLH